MKKLIGKSEAKNMLFKNLSQYEFNKKIERLNIDLEKIGGRYYLSVDDFEKLKLPFEDGVQLAEVKVPTLEDLINDERLPEEKERDSKRKELSIILNTDPPKSWIKKHPIGNYEYIPIERIEYLLSRIFVRWWVEVIGQPILIANSVVVNVRVFVINPITGEVEHNDGVGAEPLQTNSGANPNDIMAMKSNAVKLAVPNAKTNAIKDAVEMWGKIFGKDINRQENIDYSTILRKNTGESKIRSKEDVLMQIIKNAETPNQLEKIKDKVNDSNDELKNFYLEKINEVKKIK